LRVIFVHVPALGEDDRDLGEEKPRRKMRYLEARPGTSTRSSDVLEADRLERGAPDALEAARAVAQRSPAMART
jgi:hypothetical protein